MIGDEPVAVQHQPFTYTAKDGKLVVVMDDGSWEYNYQGTGSQLTMDYEGGSAVTFDKADDAKAAQYAEWGKRELLTGWGNFLRINTGLPWGNPTSGGGGLAE